MRTRAGFTLLEILVVLAMLGLITAMVLPRLTSVYDSVQAGLERDDVMRAIGELSYRAHLQGSGFELRNYPDPDAEAAPIPLTLPEGWRVLADPPIRYYASGGCSGGELLLRYGEAEYRLRLRAPFCHVELL